jgi:hypothetical protein
MKNQGCLVEVPHLGDRSYVHGTSVYSFLSEHLSEYHEGRGFLSMLSFRRMMAHLPLVVQHRPSPAKMVGDFSIRGEAETTQYWLQESEVAPAERVEYDESVYTAAARINHEGAALAQFPRHTLVRASVALVKAHHNRFLPSAEGQWVFSRLILDTDGRGLEGDLAIRLHAMVGTQSSRSHLMVNGERVGELWFGVHHE